jgi:hypothetical protein
LLRDNRYRNECLQAMAMAPELGAAIVATLTAQSGRRNRP